MQNFSYHTHTNTLGVYDGRNTAAEMIQQAENIGYVKMGISNHLCFHPNIVLEQSQMFFDDFPKAADCYKRTVDEIRTASLNFKIDVKVGFEVDFFPSRQWRDLFEKLQKEIGADYYIGATHFLRNKSEQYLMNLYYLHRSPVARIDEEYLTVYLNNYWDNIIAAIKSGYCSFIAHLDVCKLFGYCMTPEWNDRKLEVVETLAHYHQPCELNTSGWTKVGEQHPEKWVLAELAKRNVPIIISDDAHAAQMLAQHFERAESLLSELNYTNRFCPEF